MRGRPRSPDLTPREQEIAQAIVTGRHMKQLEWELGMARGSLQQRLFAIYNRLNLPRGHDRRILLVRYWVERTLKEAM